MMIGRIVVLAVLAVASVAIGLREKHAAEKLEAAVAKVEGQIYEMPAPPPGAGTGCNPRDAKIGEICVWAHGEYVWLASEPLTLAANVAKIGAVVH